MHPQAEIDFSIFFFHLVCILHPPRLRSPGGFLYLLKKIQTFLKNNLQNQIIFVNLQQQNKQTTKQETLKTLLK